MEFAGQTPVKLPIYLVVDCSSSMTGEPIEGVKQGIRALALELRDDSQLAGLAWLGLLVYSSHAGQVLPLTSLNNFKLPKLKTGGTSSLGTALTLLSSCIKQEVRAEDWQPLVFLFTDGASTDEWQASLSALTDLKKISLIVCGAGSNTELADLAKVAQGTLLLNTLTVGDFEEYITWQKSS